MEYINGSELANKRFIRLKNGDLREASKGKFIPKAGEEYWYLDAISGGCKRGCIEYGCVNNWIAKHNLVFRTKEECMDYRDFLDELDNFTFEPNWDDESQEKWYLRFDHNGDELSLVCRHDMQHQGVCFQSEEKGLAFVETVGIEAVERYMFDYWR